MLTFMQEHAKTIIIHENLTQASAAFKVGSHRTRAYSVARCIADNPNMNKKRYDT